MFTIIENQVRPDGIINQTKETRSTFAAGLSYFYDRCSKMVMTELYTAVHIVLLDDALNVIEHKDIETLYHVEE